MNLYPYCMIVQFLEFLSILCNVQVKIIIIKPRMKFTKCTTKSPIDILSTSTSILEASFVGKFVYDIFDTRQAFEDYINDSDDDVSN